MMAAAAAAVALLLLVAPQLAAAQGLLATLSLEKATAEPQFAWTVVAAPPKPAFLRIPSSSAGTIEYSNTFRRRLQSLQLTVSGTAEFANRGRSEAVVQSGEVAVCNGYFRELGAKRPPGNSSASGGCLGSTYSIQLTGVPKKVPAGATATVTFSGTVDINVATAQGLANSGVMGPVASVYVDAVLAGGGRAVSSPKALGLDVAPGVSQELGAIATAYDEFVTAPIPPLTIKPSSTYGAKIPDGLGLKMADSNTYTFKAVFKYIPGKTPCNIPLFAVNTVSLVVDNPGDAPLPEPQSTSATIIFTGCKTETSSRFGAFDVSASSSVTWDLTKKANVTRLRLKPGGTGAVLYRVTAARAAPSIGYTVRGDVLVSAVGGTNAPAGSPPVAIKKVTVQLSTGDTGTAYCQPPDPRDNSTRCPFDGISYSILGGAPEAGKATATVELSDGSKLTPLPGKFDFTELPPNFVKGGRAAVTDAFSSSEVAKLREAGAKLQWDDSKKPPGEGDVPILIDDDNVYEYVLKVTAGSKCGSWSLSNTARLAPVDSEQAPLASKSSVAIEVEGCSWWQRAAAAQGTGRAFRGL